VARRRFRYDPALGQMVEVLDSEGVRALHGIQGEIQPFVHNGKVIESRTQLRDYMERHSLVQYDPQISQNGRQSVAEQQREQQQFREQLWETIDRKWQNPRNHRGGRK
jgi:hypothetical protein